MTSGFESAAESMVQEFIEATSGEIKFGVVKVWEFDGEHPVTKIYSWEADFEMPQDVGDLEEGDEFEVDGTIQLTEHEG